MPHPELVECPGVLAGDAFYDVAGVDLRWEDIEGVRLDLEMGADLADANVVEEVVVEGGGRGGDLAA